MLKIITAAGLLCLSMTASHAQEWPNEPVRFGIARVHVAVEGAFLCADPRALEVAGDETARHDMGDFNYTRALLLGGCEQLHVGQDLMIRSLGTSMITAAQGQFAYKWAFTDWNRVVLTHSSLHVGCTPGGCELQY